uniref:cysteine dioxygenase n=1 Tax=Wollemia nobilis TaxID=56998 RepID=A0A0C9QVR7_9CONI
MPRRGNGAPVQGIERNRKPSVCKGLSSNNNGSNGVIKKSAVQRLYEMCVETFSPPGTLPSPEAIQKLRSFLDTIKPLDVGLKEITSEQDISNGSVGRPNMQKGKGKGKRPPNRGAGFAPPITYLHVYQCDSFSMGIFCLPPLAVLPLHNHPGMTVLSKLLYGSMHVRSYDCMDPTDSQQISAPPQSRLAKMKVDTVHTAPCEPSILCPRTGGNIHSFTAVTYCAVLDVLAPPYSDQDGRHCSYYRDYPYSRPSEDGSTSDEDQSYVWLEEIERPEDFLVRGGQYLGPVIEA